MSIWCVEDDASIRDIEVYTLQSTGFEAVGFADAASFREALKQDKRINFCIVFMGFVKSMCIRAKHANVFHDEGNWIYFLDGSEIFLHQTIIHTYQMIFLPISIRKSLAWWTTNNNINATHFRT